MLSFITSLAHLKNVGAHETLWYGILYDPCTGLFTLWGRLFHQHYKSIISNRPYSFVLNRSIIANCLIYSVTPQPQKSWHVILLASWKMLSTCLFRFNDTMSNNVKHFLLYILNFVFESNISQKLIVCDHNITMDRLEACLRCCLLTSVYIAELAILPIL